MTAFGATWVDQVCLFCDPVFASAAVGFQRQILYTDATRTVPSALLWEADPASFAATYPDSGVVESYGPGWARVDCIDYWVNLDHDQQRSRVSVEGWDFPDVALDLTGHGRLDGGQLSALFARVLGVPRILPEDGTT